MEWIQRRTLVALLLATLPLQQSYATDTLAPEPPGEAQPWLCLTGSNTIGEHLAPKFVEAFARSQGLSLAERRDTAPDEATLRFKGPAQDLEAVLRFHGTGTGFAELRDRRCDLWMASRPAKPEELKTAGFRHLRSAGQEAVVALDGLAIIVHPDNPVSELTRDEVRDLFAGKLTNWSQVGGRDGPIRLHARDDASGTFDTFKTLVLGELAISAGASRYESTTELSRMVAVDSNAVGFVGLAGAGQNRALRIRDGDAPALAPTEFNVATEDYALARRLYFYTRAERSPELSAFITFVQSEAAQKLVADVGFVPMTLTSRAVSPRADAPTEYMALVDNAERLSLSFRFGSGQSFLDSRAARDLDRLAEFLGAPERAGTEVILVGFTEIAESSPIVSIGHSTDRADIVAQQLVKRGVVVRHVRGFGPALPITAGNGEPARAKNRRVEVWLRRRAAPVSEPALAGS
ncbi:MAG: substrate-binding domain-containing protein [Ahniella sp.]|nr:substrate-binding domain-containing protein [Ahniella sp.]